LTLPSAAAGAPFDDVSATVQLYLEGTQRGQPELIEQAFAPGLEVQWLGERGELRRRSAAAYIDMFRDLRYRDRKGHIVAIDATDTAASVKAEIEWMGRRYTDYMLLLKIEGEWKIISKIAVWADLDSSEAE
ncbi:MAG: nuclear transport factor 2 family protein, partial [Pseudomonadota bacterium]